ncbi:MAG: beta-1,6-N-acetylglucosaminyltransferase [Dysgonamonadaceae bacterium]|jgi:hypothetical protein|nr:beta-1,6-N-acetylglucosaminyltransferase [Dysgonamonadaceae bacterium]
MSKIAIMMLIHQDNEQVKKLIKHLSKDFDIYVHIDKRALVQVGSIQGQNVFVYKEYKTYWGSFNQIMATLYLLEKAYKKGYNRYMLISGQDLPIKTNKEIKVFFENNDMEYISIEKIPRQDGWPDMSKFTRYHFDQMNKRIEGKIFIKVTAEIFSKLMSIIKPRKLDYDFYGGSNWTNYTHNCVRKILEYLENNPTYINRFKWTKCADEIFYQTIVNQLDGLKITNDCLRYINWTDGPEYPRTLRINDYDKIMSSNKLFARKFDIDKDREVIEKIYRCLEVDNQKLNI